MQDLGKERVEERATGVDDVEAMRDEFSLRLKTKDQNRNKDLNYTTLRKIEEKSIEMTYLDIWIRINMHHGLNNPY